MTFPVSHHPDIPKKLHAGWCGPAAISAATGRSAEEACAAINRTRGRKPYHQTQGVYVMEIRQAVASLGFDARLTVLQKGEKAKPMRRFLQERPQDFWCERLILWTRDHFVTVYQGTLVDSNNPDGIPWRDYKKLRSQVRGFMVVKRARSLPLGLDGWDPKDHGHYARKKERESWKRKAQALARHLIIEIRDLGDELLMESPAGLMFPGCTHFESISYARGEKMNAWIEAVDRLEWVKKCGWDQCDPDGCDCELTGEKR